MITPQIISSTTNSSYDPNIATAGHIQKNSTQTVANAIFRSLRIIFDAVMYIPLRIMQGFNYLANVVSQLFIRTFFPNNTNPVNLKITRACAENNYFAVWKELKNTNLQYIDNETIIEMQAMIARLRSLRAPIIFEALNRVVANLACARNLPQ